MVCQCFGLMVPPCMIPKPLSTLPKYNYCVWNFGDGRRSHPSIASAHQASTDWLPHPIWELAIRPLVVRRKKPTSSLLISLARWPSKTLYLSPIFLLLHNHTSSFSLRVYETCKANSESSIRWRSSAPRSSPQSPPKNFSNLKDGEGRKSFNVSVFFHATFPWIIIRSFSIIWHSKEKITFEVANY